MASATAVRKPSWEVIEGDCVEAMAAMDACSVDAVVCDPPYNLSFMSRAWDRIDGEHVDPAFLHWFAGFVDGEGCFSVHKKNVSGYETYDCQFSISLRADDRPILERIQRTLGMGTLSNKAAHRTADRTRPGASPQARYSISRKADCIRLRELFRGFPLRAKKAQDMELWSDALDAWVEHEPGGGWNDVAEARSLLMASRAYVEEGIRVDPFQMWCWRWGREAMRVLKPGGHCLAFGGTRTVHRLTAGLEDAGFEIRDTIAWMYGSGFPKSLDVGKAIDKRGGRPDLAQHIAIAIREAREARGMTTGEADRLFCGGTTNWTWFEGRKGECRPPTPKTFARIVEVWPELASLAEMVAEAEREVIGSNPNVQRSWRSSSVSYAVNSGSDDLTAPATPSAAQWDGWGTALKPAHEPIVVARKPLTGTVSRNVLEHGTGALNVDACRIGTEGGTTKANPPKGASHGIYGDGINGACDIVPLDAGRWPANVVLAHTDECVPVGTRKVKPVGATAHQKHHGKGQMLNPGEGKAEHPGYRDADGTETVTAWSCDPSCPVRLLDEQTGELGISAGGGRGAARGLAFGMGAVDEPQGFGDSGGASRFMKTVGHREEPTRFRYVAKASSAERNAGLDGFEAGHAPKGNYVGRDLGNERNHLGGLQGSVQRNVHPTVKPIDLMRWLVRLVTPPGGTILDPFTGSGTTGCAAVLEGFDFIGIERDPDYIEIARARIAWWAEHPEGMALVKRLEADQERKAKTDAGQLGLFEEAGRASR